MTINDMKSGDSAQITHLDLLHPQAMRLLDLGFIPGTSITFLRRAPLGDPLVVEIRRRTLMLRKDEALAVSVSAEEKS